jgi:hypothetical protein
MQAVRQLSLFDQRPASPPPTDPHVAAEDERRLTGQNRTILYMLRQRPHTNDELADIARKYTSRISDLRAAGYRVRCDKLKGGLTLYTLEE